MENNGGRKKGRMADRKERKKEGRKRERKRVRDRGRDIETEKRKTESVDEYSKFLGSTVNS